VPLALGAAVRPAHADWTFGLDGRTGIYQDTDRTFISTTVVAGSVSPRDVLSIQGHYLADIITSASVDVMSSATPKPFHETRHEGAGSVSYKDGTNTLSGGYVYSVEHDYRSHSGNLSLSRDFLRHQLTLGVSGGFSASDVGRADDPTFHRSLLQGDASFDVGIAASRRDLVTFNYTFIYLSGYQASPYRHVYFKLPSGVGPPGARPEIEPPVRARHALAVRWNHHAFTDTAIKSHLRAYVDDWGVLSLTGGVEYIVGFGDFEGSVFVRGYGQSKATFYKPLYDTSYAFMTADRELATFLDAFSGLRIGWARGPVGVFDELRADLKGTLFVFHFFDFPLLTDRKGIIGELALGGSF
jgi:hypothetical protein